MNMRRNMVLLGLVIVSCALSYWMTRDKEESPIAAPEVSKVPAMVSLSQDTTQPVTLGDSVVVPDNLRLSQEAAVPMVRNWKEWTNNLTEAEQKIVEDFRSRYHEAYQFVSEEQLKWMIARGYPTPAEILLAAQVPLDELVAQGMAGNLKASTLAMDRLVVEATADGALLADSPLHRKIIGLRRAETQRNCSPFSYYVQARYFEELGRTQTGFDPSRLLHSLAARGIVVQLGDRRAMQYAEQLANASALDGRAAMNLAVAASQLRSRLPPNCPFTAMPRN